MEFTKQEKHNLYIKCLKDIENNTFICCCASFFERIDWSEKSFLKFLCKDVFFELYELRTIYSHVYWFYNRQERIDALKKCIEMTK